MAWKLIRCYANRSVDYSADEWNNATGEQRHKLAESFCRKFVKDKAFRKTGDEYTYSDEDWAEFLEELTRINHHTERTIIQCLLEEAGIRF
jgi:hypothetical protein